MISNQNAFITQTQLISKYGNISERSVFMLNLPTSFFLWISISTFIIAFLTLILFFLSPSKSNDEDSQFFRKNTFTFINPILVVFGTIFFILFSHNEKKYNQGEKETIESIAKRISSDGSLINSDGDRVKNDADIATIRSLVASYHDDKK